MFLKHGKLLFTSIVCKIWGALILLLFLQDLFCHNKNAHLAPPTQKPNLHNMLNKDFFSQKLLQIFSSF